MLTPKSAEALHRGFHFLERIDTGVIAELTLV